jgi:hypothetical protein
VESIVNRTVPRDFGRRTTAATFPDGIGAAWRRLEAVYPPRKGRRFYGLTRFDAGQLPYFAAVVPPTEQAAAPAGFVRLIMQGGLYARVKLEGWTERTGEFAQVFDYLMERFELSPGGYSVEFYRSQREAHLMIPVVTPDRRVPGGSDPGGAAGEDAAQTHGDQD